MVILHRSKLTAYISVYRRHHAYIDLFAHLTQIIAKRQFDFFFNETPSHKKIKRNF